MKEFRRKIFKPRFPNTACSYSKSIKTTTHFVPKYKLKDNVIPELIGLSYCIQNSGVYMTIKR